MSVANGPDDDGPVFSYSTGIYHRLKAPELLIIGLDGKLCAPMINYYGNQILEGAQSFKAGDFYSGFLEGFDIYMFEPDERARKEYAIWADWFYERQPFPILQCVWPTTSGVWPWEDAFGPDLTQIQPMLGPIPMRN